MSLKILRRSAIVPSFAGGISRLAGQDQQTLVTTGGTCTATYPSATGSGHLLIASLMENGVNLATSPLTDTNVGGTGMGGGWHLIEQKGINNNARGLALFYKIADGTESTIQGFVTSATAIRLQIYEYQGNLTSGVLDQQDNLGNASVNNSTTLVSSLQTGTITTTQAKELIFCTFGFSATVNTPILVNNGNVRQQSATLQMYDSDWIVSTTGSYSVTTTWTTAVRASGLIASFKSQ